VVPLDEKANEGLADLVARHVPMPVRLVAHAGVYLSQPAC
jgi:hypothetical protein